MFQKVSRLSETTFIKIYLFLIAFIQFNFYIYHFSCVVNCLQKTVANVEAIFKVEFTTTSLPSPKETPSYKWKLSRTNSKQNILPLPEGKSFIIVKQIYIYIK